MLKRSCIFASLILGLLSCGDSSVVFQDTHEMAGESWHKDSTVVFDFDIKDTNTLHDFYFNLRTTSSYEWANLFVFAEIKAPNELFNIDTVEFVLANKKGEWNGRKSGSIIENDLLFITKKRFPASGTYSLKFTQAMRQDQLSEIVDVGLRIKEITED